MTEQAQDKSTIHGRGRRFALCIIALSLLIVAGVFIWSRSRIPTIEERLAAIEAARAIPDSENAALVYNHLLENPGASWPSSSLAFLDGDSIMLTRSQPWLERDYPEIADWISERQWLIDELLAATQFEKCHFPIDIEPSSRVPVDRLRTMRPWTFLLKQAANNDVAEGRIDSAIAKWRCMIQLGRHLQQCTLIELLEGISYEAVASRRASDYVMQGDPDEHLLQKIASLLGETRDSWDDIRDRIDPVEKLRLQKYKRSVALVDRLKYQLGIGVIGKVKDIYPHVLRKRYLELLAYKRGLYILIALRRHQKQYQRWPDDLDAIRPRLPAEILVDPINGGDFVYRLTNDGFTLYSRGENNIDEGGRGKSRSQESPDDKRIWPL